MARLVSPAQGWSSFCQFQYNCLVATANLMQSRDALAKAEKAAKGYGVEIAYLTAARQFASAALTTAKDKNCRVNPSDVAGLLAAINARLQQATDDNNHIYIEAVPSAKALPSIGMILMAKPTEPEEFSKTETVPPLFSSLVPPEVRACCRRRMLFCTLHPCWLPLTSHCLTPFVSRTSDYCWRPRVYTGHAGDGRLATWRCHEARGNGKGEAASAGPARCCGGWRLCIWCTGCNVEQDPNGAVPGNNRTMTECSLLFAGWSPFVL